jgi:hypothetical protein
MTYRSASRSVVLLALLAAPRAIAAEPLRATLTCAPVAEPGRVRCDVDARIDSGTITWADVEVLSVPDLAAPLKGRIGPHEATLKEPNTWRFAMALVAKRAGVGNVVVRVRAVACDANDACTPLVAEAKGEVHVGP